jgi:tagaturonate reductase
MYERFKRMGEKRTGFVVLSCELIDQNGYELKRCVLQYVDHWKLEDSFRIWVEKEKEIYILQIILPSQTLTTIFSSTFV